MTLDEKILQTQTANFAISKINSQVPPVSLKAELTVSIFMYHLATITTYHQLTNQISYKLIHELT